MSRFVLLSGKTVAPCAANDCGCGFWYKVGDRLSVPTSGSHRKHSSKEIVRSIRDRASLAPSCLSGGELCKLRERDPAYRHGIVGTQLKNVRIQTKINDLGT